MSTWNDYYFSLSLFRATRGPDIQPSKDDDKTCWGDISEKDLSSWVKRQNRERKISGLSSEQIVVLESVCFPWELGNHEKWGGNFTNLVGFRALHGHCNVPKSTNTLANWVRNQRLAYKLFLDEKDTTLSADMIERLESIGFQFDALEVAWDSKFALLEEYIEEHGHCKVVRKNPLLGRWVAEQRTQFKERTAGKKSAMTEDRI